ncbi:hypothetical protein HY732_02130 [Candidatus Uhrbacteria bacterium]|nr:hypothetical protein [Candidatus Uhrbacteria bacterium]
MKKIYSKQHGIFLNSDFSVNIDAQVAGMYCIEIHASAKSWWQNTVNGRAFLKKDSMTPLINNKNVISIRGKNKLLVNDLWNGNILKGAAQTAYIVASFSAGAQTLSFSVLGKPLLSSIAVYLLENKTVELNGLKTEKRDRTPWLVFMTYQELGIASVSISAMAPQSKKDDDDIQLKIDGKIVKNEDLNAHKAWYWCGKILKGKKKEFQKEFTENTRPFRIDIVADGTPCIENIRITLEKKPILFIKQDVRPYTLKGVDRKNKNLLLWSVITIFFASLVVSIGIGAYAYQSNGMFWLSFDQSQEEGATYVLTLNETRGIITHKTPITTRYSNGDNFYGIEKDDTVTFYSQEISNEHISASGKRNQAIIIEGVSAQAKIVYVLQNRGGEWVSIPNSGEPGISGPAPAFRGHDISFFDVDGTGWDEVKSSFYVGYSNASDEVWHSWYRYEPMMKSFVFFKKNKENVANKHDFSAAEVDEEMVRESKYYKN